MLSLYNPELQDLSFRRRMLEDPATMSYNHHWGGTVSFPEEDWDDWYDHWIVKNEGRRFYRYLQNEDGELVGEIAYHYDRQNNCLANVLIYAPFRGRGYGSKALDILCDCASENGVREMYDDIAIDNPAISLFLKHGFKEEYRTDEIIMLKRILINE